MKFLVERLGGSLTSDRPETEEDDQQGILFDTGVFSDSDDDEGDQYNINKQQMKKSTFMKVRVLMGPEES